MKQIKEMTIIACLSAFLMGSAGCRSGDAVDYVDPFIGSHFFAHTFPGPSLPFAMVQLSPDTDTEGWNASSGYQYADSTILGFSHTHFSGTGAALAGDILLMPFIGNRIEIKPGPRSHSEQGYRSRFDHKDEAASPGYYRVLLKDHHIQVELTVTQRAGFHRYTFPRTPNAHILLDLGHHIGYVPAGASHVRIVDNRRIEGYTQSIGGRIFFSAEFSKPFAAFGTWDRIYQTPESGEGVFPYKTEETGEQIGAFVDYDVGDDEAILVKVGLSFVSIDNARENLVAEIPDWDFDRIRAQARNTWNKYLRRVKVEGGSREQKRIFYTALYHAFIAQQSCNDRNGWYPGMDGREHKAEGFDFYPSFFAWDTFRSEHPLMTLVAADHVTDMLKSIEAKCREYGWLPSQHIRNTFGQGMVGDHLTPIVVDAYLKGFREFDADYLYGMMRKKAMDLPPAPIPPSAARAGVASYRTLGYLPADKHTESVSSTLEFCYDDWCIAQMARALGKEDDYQLFMQRAGNYRLLFDPETRFMRPRLQNGSWLKSCCAEPAKIEEAGHFYYDCFDPLWVGRRPYRHYTESNAWQYLWFVPHDVSGLIQLFAGPQPFIQKLDTFFTMSPEITGPKYVGVVGAIGQYVHGNQPSHHVAYLYNYAGMPWKTQAMVRRIMEELYRTGPGGLCGNEDMGSLSSWYVFSAMGFYPVCPGDPVYAVGTPLFERVEVQLDAVDPRAVFTVCAEGVSSKNRYIQSADLNGRPLQRPWIRHEDIRAGGKLHLKMGPNPNRAWGTGPKQ